MTDFEIIYNDGNGKIIIHGENFFPCSQSNLKKLCKIIDTCTDPHGKVMELYSLLKNHRDDLHGMVNQLKGNFNVAYQNKCDTEHAVTSGRFPNGIPLKRDELKSYKKKLKEEERYVKQIVSDFKKYTKAEKKLGSNMELLKTMYERWFEE